MSVANHLYMYLYYMLVRLNMCLNHIKGTIIILLLQLGLNGRSGDVQFFRHYFDNFTNCCTPHLMAVQQ